MLKKNGQPCSHSVPHFAGKLTESELRAYNAAFVALEESFNDLGNTNRALCELEKNADAVTVFDASESGGQVHYLETQRDHRGRWQIRSRLLTLLKNEVLLCQRPMDAGVQFAIIERSTSANAEASCEVRSVGNNPVELVRDYARTKRKAVELAAGELIARTAEDLGVKFPEQELNRVVKALAQRCTKEVLSAGTSAQTGSQKVPANCQNERRGMGI